MYLGCNKKIELVKYLVKYTLSRKVKKNMHSMVLKKVSVEVKVEHFLSLNGVNGEEQL